MRGARLIAGLTFSLGMTGVLARASAALSAWHPTLAVTVIHVLLALAFMIAIVPFFLRHLGGERKRALTSAGGLALLSILTGVIASGAALVVFGQRGSLPFIHFLFSALLVVGLLRHAGSLRPRLTSHKGGWRLKLGAALVFVAVLTLASRIVGSEEAPAATQLPLSSIRIAGGLPPYDASSMAPESCVNCHSQVAEEWKQSLHAVADSEIVYARVVAEFRREHGVEASNWCAGCHSPLRLARGQLNIKVADVDQPNVDCVTCHSIRQVHRSHDNLNFDLGVRRPAGYGVGATWRVSDRLLLMQPGAHRDRWNDALTSSPEFCAACHRQTLPRFLTGAEHPLTLQDTFGEWERSRFNSDDPAQRRTCQDCHMPERGSPLSLLGGGGRSHIFAGASVDIARLGGARAALQEHRRLLAKTASLSLGVEGCDSQGVSLLVKVTNYGAGHNLPTGVTDLREVWLEITARDDSGRAVYQSGAVDAEGFLDPQAARFGVTLGDKEGRPVRLHDIIKARRVLQDTTIPAGETRNVRYLLPLRHIPRAKVEARLLYRTVPQHLLNHFMTPDLRFQIIEMASASMPLEMAPLCAAPGGVAGVRHLR